MSARRNRPAPPDVCLTVDVEPDCPPYLWTWRGIAEGLPRLLDLFDEEGVATTCFVTGETAGKFPEAVRDLVARGHELGCHGMSHTAFTRLDRERARGEISEATDRLRGFAPVRAFRAPYLSFPDAYLDLLEEAGLTLDSSQARYKPGYGPGYGRGRPAHAGLARVPASVTSSVLRLPAFIRDPWLRALRSPVVLFVHPWEFVDLTGVRLRYDCRFRTGAPALADLRAVIRLFKGRGARFLRLDELASQPAASIAAARA